MLVSVRVPEINFEERGSSSGVMDNRSNNALDVSLSFGVVKIAISGRGDSFGFGCSVDTSRFSFSLT